jgi:hypothetical protein
VAIFYFMAFMAIAHSAIRAGPLWTALGRRGSTAQKHASADTIRCQYVLTGPMRGGFTGPATP